MIKLIWMVVIPLVLAMEWYQEGNPTFLESNNYDTNLKDSPNAYKFIKFFTPYCRYCRFLKAVIDEIKSENHRDDIIFYEFNCNNHPNKCMQLGIYSYPHIIIYGPQGKQLTTLSGFYPKQIMKNFILTSMPPLQPKPQQPIKVEPPKQPSPQKPQETKKPQPQPPKQPQIPKQQPKILIQQKQKPNNKQPAPNAQMQYQNDILTKPPSDINEKEQKQMQNQIKKQIEQEIIQLQGQQQQPQNYIKSIVKIFIYIGIVGAGGYYFHSIMKIQQPIQTQLKQQHFQGKIHTNKPQTNHQVLQQQYELTRVKDEDL